MLLDKLGHLKLADFGTCMKMNSVRFFTYILAQCVSGWVGGGEGLEGLHTT